MRNNNIKGKSVKIQEMKMKQIGLGEISNEIGMQIREMERSYILRKMSEIYQHSRKARESKVLALLPKKE